MGHIGVNKIQKEMLDLIKDYVSRSSGLLLDTSEIDLKITQKLDRKTILIGHGNLGEVLRRSDENGMTFIQVNFKNGKKILITDTLIGFKPFDAGSTDLLKLPKVVTTPDVLSVFEAIEETLGSGDITENEVEVLKKVYLAVIRGGEDVGFDLSEEKRWLERLMSTQLAATA